MDRKKRKFDMGRPAAATKIGDKQVTEIRGRGNNTKFRALRLETGNFSWGSEVCTRKVKIQDVVYNASNNELVRTKTLVKGCIVLVDAHPFKLWFESHYGKKVGMKKEKKLGTDKDKPTRFLQQSKKEKNSGADKVAITSSSKSVERKLDARVKATHVAVEASLDDQFSSGRLYARITSRPGQSGRCDGYILEGKELEFYKKQMAKK